MLFWRKMPHMLHVFCLTRATRHVDKGSATPLLLTPLTTHRGGTGAVLTNCTPVTAL